MFCGPVFVELQQYLLYKLFLVLVVICNNQGNLFNPEHQMSVMFV